MAGRRADGRLAPSSHHGAPNPSSDSSYREGRVVRFRSQDGLDLAARVFRANRAAGLPLLCLPGLSRNSRDFLRLGQFSARHPRTPRDVVAVDYRGRGLSQSDRNWRNYTPLIEAQDVLAAAAALGIERAVIIGTSRGGIIAMLLGALRPALLAGVVLNDIGPVIDGTGLARIKQYLTASRTVTSWPEAVQAVRAIGGTHFPALDDDDWDALARSIFAETPRGLDPAFDRKLLNALRDFDFTERTPVLWPQFESLSRVPVLAVRGEHSDILSPRTLADMAESHPRLERYTVSGQGHAPLLRDHPSLERIADFASSC